MRRIASLFKKGIPVALLGLVFAACSLEEDSTDPTYTVSFSPGEGSGTAPVTQTVEAGKRIILPTQGVMTPPAGKTFTGWKTEEIIYYPGAGFTVNADASFAAQWNSSTNINDPFVDFYNYPNGRVDQGASWK